MGRLVLHHALLPAVKGLRLKPSAPPPMLSPGYGALQEAEPTRGDEPSDFHPNWYISESSFQSQPRCLVGFFFSEPANKRGSVLSITMRACKSTLSPSPCLPLLRATIVFLLPLPKWMLFTLKKKKKKKKKTGEKKKKRHALKKPGRRFNCFASPPWLENPRLWNVNSWARGRWELWR